MSTDLLAVYDAELRTTAEMALAQAWHRHGPLFVGLYGPAGAPDRGHVSYADLSGCRGAALEGLVAEVVAWFRDETPVTTFEWKTRGHDDAPGLEDALRAQGLEPEETESVMLGRADALAAGARGLPAGVRLRQITEPADIRAMVAVQDHVFGRATPGRADELIAHLAAGDPGELWVAEVRVGDGWQIVSAGRLDPVEGSAVAGIWGGVTLAEHRGRGIYRALTAARAESALRLGKTWIHSDSTNDSRPILERSGLTCITTTTPWVWQRP